MSIRFENAPFSFGGTRVKAGFHCHTVNSDGGLTPEQTVERYRARGFQCVGITDHYIVTKVADDSVLTPASTENGGDPDLIAVGVSSAVDRDLPLAERARLLAGQGGFTIAAHPTYCAVLPDTYLACNDLMAMEIYNAYCDSAYANGYAVELWDMVLGRGKRIWGIAGDDAHLNPRKRYYSDAGYGWNEIWVADPTGNDVVEALKRGEFFATQGPMFEEIIVGQDTIRLSCSPVAQVRWRTFGKVGFVEYSEGGSEITSAVLPDGFRANTFVRIELVDRDGKRAWSNPFFFTDT